LINNKQQKAKFTQMEKKHVHIHINIAALIGAVNIKQTRRRLRKRQIIELQKQIEKALVQAVKCTKQAIS
jgi:hypothetical protein